MKPEIREAAGPVISLLSSRGELQVILAAVGPVQVGAEALREPRSRSLIVADFADGSCERTEGLVRELLRPGDAVLGLVPEGHRRPAVFLDGEVKEIGELLPAAKELFALLANEAEVESRSRLRSRIQEVVADPAAASLMEELVAEHLELHRQLRARLQKRTQALTETMGDLQQTLRKLQDTQGQLLQAAKLSAVGQLAAGVAHEINNPLAVILGFAQGLERRVPAGDPLHLPVSSIVRESLRCKGLVQELLTFSRTAKKTTEDVNPNALLQGVGQLLESRARIQGTRIVFDLAEVPVIRANGTQLQQVVVNLGNNALDALGQGGEVVLRSRRSEADGVTLEVRDNGPGIPKDLRALIFEPFFTTKEVGKGTGLGLSIAHEIVQQHGGRIDVLSELGQGTTMAVTLPRVCPAALGAEGPLRRRAKEDALAPHEQPM